MIFELPYRRLLILTEGELGLFSAKTGVSVVRYRPNDVVGVLDSQHAGKTLDEVIAGLPAVPVFGRVSDAMAVRPDAVVVGVAPVGGQLPPRMREHLRNALSGGLSVIAGLHTRLGDDPELAALADRHHARVHDVRDPGPLDTIARGLARGMAVRRVLTVGTDCNVGKMATALELRRSAVMAGLDAVFVATGQTGIMIEGWGIAVDHVLSDFTAGAAQMLVEQVADRQICFVEGQGSIAHPGYSGVTLSLLHGVCPDAMVMCHRPDRRLHHDWADCPVAPLREQIALYEHVLSPLHGGRVVAVAVHTAGMSSGQAEAEIASIADETGLPAADPIRMGCDVLLEAVRHQLGV